MLDYDHPEKTPPHLNSKHARSVHFPNKNPIFKPFSFPIMRIAEGFQMWLSFRRKSSSREELGADCKYSVYIRVRWKMINQQFHRTWKRPDSFRHVATARTHVGTARRSGQEDFQLGTPPVSLASCSRSPFFRDSIIMEWSTADYETDSTGTSILIPLLLLNFNMRLHGNPTAWYLFLATAPPKLV